MFKKLSRSFFNIKTLPISGVLILAAFMRLYHISEYITFLGDEGRDVLVVLHILQGDLTLLGPTASVGGFFLGPIYYYMMAPFLWLFNYNPVGPAVMVALFGITTVWIIYFVTNKFFGFYPAIVSALLYAISPLVIVYSRSSWNPNVVPFFTLLMLYVLYLSVIKKSLKILLISGIIFGILLQLHYLATFLGVITFFYILVSVFFQERRTNERVLHMVKNYSSFTLGVIIGWLPFILFELRHGLNNFQSIFKFVFASGDTGGGSSYFTIVSEVFFRLFGRLLLAFPKTDEFNLYSSDILQIWGGAVYLIAFLSVGFCMYKFIKALKKRDDSLYQYLILLTWLFFGVLLFGFYKKPIYDYYLGFMYPLPFLMLGSLLSFLFTRRRKIISLGLVIIIGIILLNLNFRPFKYPGNNQVNQVKTISEFVLSKTEGKPYNFAVISSGGNSDYAYRYFFELANKKPVTIEFPGADPERKTITDQLLIVCESNPCEPRGYPLWEVAGFGQAEVVGHWPVSVLEVYKLEHASRKY